MTVSSINCPNEFVHKDSPMSACTPGAGLQQCCTNSSEESVYLMHLSTGHSAGLMMLTHRVRGVSF